jgi:hypothetical protein
MLGAISTRAQLGAGEGFPKQDTLDRIEAESLACQCVVVGRTHHALNARDQSLKSCSWVP